MVRSVVVMAVGLTLTADAGAAAPEDSTAGWQFEITPYVWVPNIQGTLNFVAGPAGEELELSVSPSGYLQFLNFPLMFGGVVRHGRWAGVLDFVYVDFSGEHAEVKSVRGPGGVVEVPVDVGSRVGLQGVISSFSGSFTVCSGPKARVDVVGGVRYFAVETSLDWQLASGGSIVARTGSTSQTSDLWDAILGGRGEVRFGAGHWYAPFELDAGTGSSRFALNAVAGVGYAFDWIDLRLVYRHLQYDGKAADPVQELRLSGPVLGVTFHF